MKKLMIGFLLLTSMNCFAKDGDMYGWDILCKGKDSFSISVRQSDDDLIMQATEKKTEIEVFATSSNDYDSEHMTLLFVSEPDEKSQLVLTVSRLKTEFGIAPGVALIDGIRHTVNCYVRYGKDEESFNEISKKPFPRITAPSVD